MTIFQSIVWFTAGAVAGNAGFSLARQQLASLAGVQQPLHTCATPHTLRASTCPPSRPAKMAMMRNKRAITL